jgi:multidrug efflux system outer membrane protein
MRTTASHSLRAMLGLPVAVALVLASGCALKSAPDEAALARENLPNLTLPAKWVEPSADGPVLNNWVAALGDARLSALVEEAITHNIDLRIAEARVEQAAAGVKAAGGQMYPTVDLLGHTGGKLGGDNSGISGALISASWEIDLWGRVRYGRRASEDQYASAEADAAAASQSVAALVAKSWFLAIEARQQHDLAVEMVANGRESVRVAKDRLRIGPGNALDVTQSEASLQTLLDAERQLAQAQAQAVRSLEMLLGRYPADEMKMPAGFATLAPAPPSGLPSELLERRPDVIAAQRRVDAAFNLVGEAQAARLPRLSLTAGISSISSEVFVLKDRDNPLVGIGANIAAPLFHGGALEAQVEMRKAEQKQAAALWAQVGLRAFGEVEGALSAEATLRDREPILVAAAKENDTLLALEKTRFRVGNSDMRTVLQREMTLYSARSALLRVQAEQHVNRVNLYLALGGGFNEKPALIAPSVAAAEPQPQ